MSDTLAHPKHECTVCGDGFVDRDSIGMFDERQKVVADDYAYHLGCRDGVIDETICVADEYEEVVGQ